MIKKLIMDIRYEFVKKNKVESYANKICNNLSNINQSKTKNY